MAKIEVRLPSSIIYVAGTVNGHQVTFQQDELNYTRWRAEVDAAEDDLYHIVLEMHDEAGNVGHYENTVEYILPVFVYDRTEQDVDRFYELKEAGWENLSQEQKEEWLGGMKGCLNTKDLKRIENDIYVIAGLMKISIQTNKDNLPEIPNALYFRQMLGNVETLRKTGYLYIDTPEVPKPPLNTYQKVNDVEKILHDIYAVFNANNSRFYYCGEIYYSGQEIGLL